MSVAFRQGAARVDILRSVSFEVGPQPVAVMGPSGSGKTTLLRVLAGLQRADSGTVVIGGGAVDPRRRTGAGDERVSLIHQDYRLVDFLTVVENLALAAELRSIKASPTQFADALQRVGLGGFEERRPLTLSGGEQQRVAIARALVTRTPVLLADEPTGALDESNTRAIAHLLRAVGVDHGVSVVVATHDRSVASAMSRVLTLQDGRLSEAAATPA